jgi:CRISPR-associated protein Csb2
MPSRALLIEVRLLNGRYHGVGDWPPSPFRLFQALVAGAYGGRWRAEPDDEKDAAFCWLEQLAAPHIAAPPKVNARATMYFVPNNDIDAVEGDPRRVAEIRSGKLVRPILPTSDAPLLYAWPFNNGEDRARHMCRLAERLHTLGHGIDAAFARAEICDWAQAESRLADHGGAVARPGRPGNPESDPFCPMNGSLESLKKRHAAGVTRFAHKREGRVSLTLFNQPPKAAARAIIYNRTPAPLLFDLRSQDDTTAFQPTPQEKVCLLAMAIRDLAARRLKTMLPQRAAEIERLVVGHEAGAADIRRRVRFVPLPSIGHTHASPSIRRVMVEVPPDCPFSRNDLAVALANQTADRIDETTGEGALLVPADDLSMLWHYGVHDRRNDARHWRSVTPIALPASRRRIDPERLRDELRAAGGAGPANLKEAKRASERAAEEEAAIGAVVQALRHAGVTAKPDSIRVQREPLTRRGARAERFAPQEGDAAPRFRKERLWHVDIVLSEPVPGPLLIGDGRFVGLGLLAPAGESPPSIHLFALDPPLPVAARDGLVRALRRAVMARVDPIWRGDRRDRRNKALPVFFTGHEADGKPARSGQHEHLFFLADDADGDGKIDRLAIVAPHLADHSVVYDPQKQSAIRGHLELLDRALADFTLLRAGRAGAPKLRRMLEPSDDDPLFGRAKAWMSRTPYRPTRHPKGGDINETIAADIIAECARRRLPRPDVDALDVTIGPRGGLAARVRLRFTVAVEGPLLLGQGSHSGEGEFARDGAS